MTRIVFLVFVGLLALVVGGPIVAGSQMSALMMGASGIRQAATIAGATSCDVPMVGAGQSETGVTMAQLTPDQVRRAHIVWQVARELGFGDRGAIVGMVTLAQESTWGADPKTRRPDSNVDVADFQQRALPGWYAGGKTVEENVRILSDTRYAARTFFTGYKVTAADVAAARANGTEPAGPVGYVTPGLASVKGWESLPVTVAAQRVQRSAYPGHYAKHEPLARQLVEKFNAEAPPPAGPPSQATMVDGGQATMLNAGQTVNDPLCDPAGADPSDVAQCPDSGLAAEKGLTPDAMRVLRCAFQQWPDLTYGGVRPDSMEYHPSGKAIDIMVPGTCAPLGQTIADWAKQNAASLGVDHVIWCQKIWSVQRSGEGWRTMTSRGSSTADHKDHVHITVFGNSAGTNDAASVPEGGASAVAPVGTFSLSARYNQRGSAWSSGFHTGLDLLPVPVGSNPPVLAAKAGTVAAVTSDGPYGNMVKLDHGGNVKTWYAHLQSTKVKEGQKVTAGTVLGPMGRTGNVRGANPEHLHWEVHVNGARVDPERWAAAQGIQLSGSGRA